jgi:hypothetical protein
MAMIELHLALEVDATSCQPEVRAWIDVHPDLGLDSELELPLSRREPHHWIGFFTVPEAWHGYFSYRIGVAAHAGAIWKLAVRRRDCTRALLCDADSLALPKQWLAGTCHLPT